VRLPEPGQLVRDRWLTRRWTGCTARLWTPIPAWLIDHDGTQVLVDDAPAGSCIHIDQVWRVGPLIADLRVLGSPAVTSQLWLVAPWPAVDLYPAPRHWPQPHNTSRPG
jgi:hypothetical protein